MITTTQPPAAGKADRFAGLAAESWGRDDQRSPLLLLHGLTFDRSIWRGIVVELQRIDPDRRVVALDLPGHGGSPEDTTYDLVPVAERVHAAVEDAGLLSPVVVGHSAAGGIASVYGGRHPTSGVVNVDASPVLAPVAQLLRSIADGLRGPDFTATWQLFWDSFHVELLPTAAQDLVRVTCRPRRQVLLGYWRALLEDPIEDLESLIDRSSAAIAAAGIPYHYLVGDDLDHDTQAWLDGQPFIPTVEVWPRTGHFPHLAHPARFAARLADLAQPRPR